MQIDHLYLFVTNRKPRMRPTSAVYYDKGADVADLLVYYGHPHGHQVGVTLGQTWAPAPIVK